MKMKLRQTEVEPRDGENQVPNDKLGHLDLAVSTLGLLNNVCACSVMCDSFQPDPIDCRLRPWDFPGKNT